MIFMYTLYVYAIFPSDKSPLNSSPRKGRPKKISAVVNGDESDFVKKVPEQIKEEVNVGAG